MAPATQTTISSFFGRMKENATATLSVALGKRKREPFQEIEKSRDIESAGWNTPPTRRIFDHVLSKCFFVGHHGLTSSKQLGWVTPRHFYNIKIHLAKTKPYLLS